MRNIKHLCIVADNYPTFSDPTFPFVEQLAEAIVRYGIDVTVIAPQSIIKAIAIKGKSHPKLVRKELGNNTLTVFQPYCISFGNHTPRINSWSRKRVVERCFEKLDNRPDVCYGHFWHLREECLGMQCLYMVSLFSDAATMTATLLEE